MFFFITLVVVMLLFSGGGYYGHRRGYYSPRMAYSGIGLGWVIILLGLLFLMPGWGMMSNWSMMH